MNLDPPPHDGINIWMMASARKCQLKGLAAWEAERMISAYDGSARRRFKPSEVRRAVEKAYSTTLEQSEIKRAPKPKWVPPATKRTTHRPSSAITAAELWEASPDRMDDGIDQSMILRWLFPDRAGLVCVGKSTYEFHTARLDQFKDLTQTQFIVPCYMTAKTGITQDGKVSMHCLDNCGPRRFCVCDFDEPKSEDHPAIIWQLKKFNDLVMVLSSGGKSLHAWFNVPEDEEADFWERAIVMGADPVLSRNRSSFVRTPWGTRDNGRRQYPLYFDQGALP